MKRVIDLGNEGNESVVDFFKDFPSIKKSQDDVSEFRAKVVPRVLEEFSWKSIRSWRLAFRHLKKGFFDLKRRKGFAEIKDLIVAKGSVEMFKRGERLIRSIHRGLGNIIRVEEI